MQLQRVRPTVLTVTLHASELSALMAAARWVAEGSPGELPGEARDHLRQLLAAYDEQVARLNGHRDGLARATGAGPSDEDA